MTRLQALLAGLTLLSAMAAGAAEPVTVQGIAAQLGSPTPVRLLDVRTRQEFAGGHIPGAVNIPIGELAGRLSELDPARSLAVYCEVGGRASRAVDLLEANGFVAVLQVQGSMRAWRAAELPVATGN